MWRLEYGVDGILGFWRVELWWRCVWKVGWGYIFGGVRVVGGAEVERELGCFVVEFLGDFIGYFGVEMLLVKRVGFYFYNSVV